jgi:hypothetical protein
LPLALEHAPRSRARTRKRAAGKPIPLTLAGPEGKGMRGAILGLNAAGAFR